MESDHPESDTPAPADDAPRRRGRRHAERGLGNSAVCRFRIPPRLRRLIDAHRGETSVSAWLRAAAAQRLEVEREIGAPLRELLAEHDRQLRGLGINLNQLAQRANEGRPVVVPQTLLDDIDARIRESRLLLTELKTRLPE